MTDNPNSFYYSGRQGTLSGFDQLNLPTTNPDIAGSGWSIDQLRTYLLNVFNQNFPSPDWVTQVDTLISQHLDDFNNPHQLSLDQIASDIVRDVVSRIAPGTPPSVAPVFAYDALCLLPLGDVFPLTYSNANIYRMTSGGLFADTSTEIEVMGTDFEISHPGIPLFSSIINLISPNWYQQATTLINTQIVPTVNPAVNYPFPSYQLNETNTTGVFGMNLVATEAAGSIYTATFMVFPLVNAGYLILSQQSDQVNTMTVNLSDGTYTCASNAVQGETFVYPSGAIKISFSFNALVGSPGNVVQVLHRNTNDASPTRQGVLGRPIFSVMQPQVSTSALNQPFAVSPTSVLTTSQIVIPLSTVIPSSTIANLMGTFAFHLYPSLPSAVITDTTLFNMGALTITRDALNIYVNVLGSMVFTTPILNGLNIISFSYSPTTVICKSLSLPRQSVSGTYPPLSTTPVTIGPCAGYLCNFALYATSDQAQCLEYLTNG